jgi:hypothetical protein
MALITCAECGSQLSSEAPACPKCGKPNAAAPKFLDPKANAKSCLGVIFFFVILWIGWQLLAAMGAFR